MNPEIKIDKLIDVIAVFKSEGGRLKCQPHRLRFDGKDIVITELGFVHPTTKGQRMLHVFDVSDGTSDYRLEFDAESLQWRLISMIEGANR